jgi:hypothetical protein
MKKALICFITVIFFCPNAIAQITGKKILNSPAKFANPEEPVVNSLQEYPTNHDNKTYDANWVVYSDRSNNPTTREPGSSGIFKRADFLQKFFVVDEQGDYVHIVKDDNNPIDVNLTALAEDYGWIHKSKLLLYKACLKNPKRITHKGMLVNTEETIQRAKQGDESTLVKFYTDPQLASPTEINSKLYQIYHIYKKEGNSVLLGKAYETRGKPSDNIVGWVPFDRVTNWQHRIAIEPNWEENAWNERKVKNIFASVFLDKNDCSNFIQGGNSQNAVWDSDPVKETSQGSFYKRAIGEWRRFPVLSYIDDKSLKIGVVGDIHTQTSIFSSNQGAETDKLIGNYASQLANKNFMFVIDGTSSMQPYFKAVSNAVRISIEELNRKYGAGAIPPNFGCVVYRDHAEKNRLIETFNLNTNISDAISFLNNVRAGDDFDTDAAEAVNYGLVYALRMLPKNESNFVILIGDAGNHTRNDPSYINDEQVVRMLEEKQCHFLAFQVANHGTYDYESFSENIEKILKQSASNIKSGNPMISNNAMTFNQTDNTANYSFNRLSDSPIVGNVLKSKAGKTVSPDILQNEITNLVEFADNIVSNLKSDVANIQSGTSYTKLILNKNNTESEYSRYVDNYNEILLNVLNNMGLTKEQAEYISQDRFQFYSPAFAAVKSNGMENDLFKPVVLMSRRELYRLNMMFSMLGNIVTLQMNERRQRFYDTWIELLSSHLGETDTERLRELSNEALSDILYGTGGLNITSSMLKWNMNCLMDPACMEDRDFNTFLSIIRSKSMTIEKILNDNNDPRQFRSSDIIYYWLDFDVLP